MASAVAEAAESIRKPLEGCDRCQPVEAQDEGREYRRRASMRSFRLCHFTSALTHG